jgi:pantothenate kinase
MTSAPPVTASDLRALAGRAARLVQPGRRALLGITGAPGAGKTTLARDLVELLAGSPPPGCAPQEWVAHVPMDGFHLADVELARLGRADRKGAPDTFDAAGYAALLTRLHEDAEADVVYAPAFEREIEQPIAGSIPIGPACRLVISEGNYLLLDEVPWPRVRGCFDEVWFCELDGDERRRRLVERHVRFGKEPAAAEAWVSGTDERNAELVARTRDHADLVVRWGGEQA